MSQNDCVLFVSAGVTDLKILLANAAGQVAVYEPDRGVARFHDWLLDRLRQHELFFVAQPESSEKGRERGKHPRFEFEAGRFFATTAAGRQELLPANGKIQLCLPKLEAVIDGLRQQSLRPRAAVVYYTDRQDRTRGCHSKDVDMEPHAVGPILRHWLASEFALQESDEARFILDAAVCINLLPDKCFLEGKGRDYPIHRSVAKILEAPMREASAALPEGLAILSNAGGFPGIKPVMQAAIAFFFAGRYRLVIDTERSTDKNRIAAPDDSISCDVSYDIRSHCARLVRQGLFVEAWNVAQTVAADMLGEAQWTAGLDKLAQLFAGRWRPPARPALHFPHRLLLSSLDCCPRTLVTALRIEAALHAGRWLDAMRLSIDFAGQCRVDAVSRLLMLMFIQERQTPSRIHPLLDEQECLHLVSGYVELKPGISPNLRDKLTNFLSAMPKSVVSPIGLNGWRIGLLAAPNSLVCGAPMYTPDELHFLAEVDALAATALPDDSLPPLLPAIEQYLSSLDQPVALDDEDLFQDEAISPRALWSRLGLLAPEGDDLEAISEVWIAAGLWHTVTNADGQRSVRFLQPDCPAGRVLAALGVREAETIFDRLVDGCIAVMRAYEMH